LAVPGLVQVRCGHHPELDAPNNLWLFQVSCSYSWMQPLVL
jgi:hypothetical protein